MAETGFVYERSEGLPGLNDSLEMPEREESHLVPGNVASWGHLGRGPKGGPEGTKKGFHFRVGFGVVLGPKMGPDICKKRSQK